MKKNEVVVGELYECMVSDKLVAVRIEKARRNGWDAVNTATGKPVFVKTAQRLRGKWEGGKTRTAKKPAPAPKAGQEEPKPTNNVLERFIGMRTRGNSAKQIRAIAVAREDAVMVDQCDRILAGGMPEPTIPPPAPEDTPAPEAQKASDEAAQADTGKETTKGTVKAAPSKKSEPGTGKRVSALDAAAWILRESGAEMNAKEILTEMLTRKLWESPNGKTPDATISAAISREIKNRGADSRFRKGARGKFAAAS